MDRERNSYDLLTLAHVMDDSTGAPEIVDRSPVLRSDIIDGLQRFLAKKNEAARLVEACGYYDVIADADAILAETPGLREFVEAMERAAHATAHVVGTTY